MNEVQAVYIIEWTQSLTFFSPICKQKQTNAPNGKETSISISLGSSAKREFERMRPLADCALKLTLDEGGEASLPSHKALLAKDSQVIG